MSLFNANQKKSTVAGRAGSVVRREVGLRSQLSPWVNQFVTISSRRTVLPLIFLG